MSDRTRVHAILSREGALHDGDEVAAICRLLDEAREEQREASAALLERAAHALYLAGSFVADGADIKGHAAVVEAMAHAVRRGKLDDETAPTGSPEDRLRRER